MVKKTYIIIGIVVVIIASIFVLSNFDTPLRFVDNRAIEVTLTGLVPQTIYVNIENISEQSFEQINLKSSIENNEEGLIQIIPQNLPTTVLKAKDSRTGETAIKISLTKPIQGQIMTFKAKLELYDRDKNMDTKEITIKAKSR